MLTHGQTSIFCLLDPRLTRLSHNARYSSFADARCSSFEQIHISTSNTKKKKKKALKSLLLPSELHIGCFLFLLRFSGGGAALYLPVTV